MGFSHSWTFASTLSKAQWESVQADTRLLIGALPELVAQRTQTMKAKGLLSRIQAHFWALQMRTPVRPVISGGSYFGPAPSGADSIAFGPEARGLAAAQPVVVANAVGHQWAKTGAHLYDHVLIGILCLANATAPGTVTVDSTDGDLEYWLHCRDWCAGVLGRTLSLPVAGRPLE